MGTTKQLLYAAIGAGELAMDKARQARESFDIDQVRKDLVQVTNDLPKRLAKTRIRVEKSRDATIARSFDVYQDLVKRGKNTVLGIRNSSPTKRAVTQTKSARRQAKAAVTSAKKAATTSVNAAREAASNI